MNWFTTIFAWAREPKEQPPKQPPHTEEERAMIEWIQRNDLDALEAKWKHERVLNGPWTTGRVGGMFLDKISRLRQFRDPWEGA
jgi:hypothetical protein